MNSINFVLLSMMIIISLLFSCDSVSFSHKSKNFKSTKGENLTKTSIKNIDEDNSNLSVDDVDTQVINEKGDIIKINDNNIDESEGSISTKESCNIYLEEFYTTSTPTIFYTQWKVYVFIPSNDKIQYVLNEATKKSKCTDKIGVVYNGLVSVFPLAYQSFQRGRQYNQPSDVPAEISKNGTIYKIKDKFGEFGSEDCKVYWLKVQDDDTYEHIGDNQYARCEIKYQ